MIRRMVGELCINTQDSMLTPEPAEGFLLVDVTQRSVIKSGHVVGAVCSNEGPRPFPRRGNSENVKLY